MENQCLEMLNPCIWFLTTSFHLFYCVALHTSDHNTDSVWSAQEAGFKLNSNWNVNLFVPSFYTWLGQRICMLENLICNTGVNQVPLVSLWVLQPPPTIWKHACQVDWKLQETPMTESSAIGRYWNCMELLFRTAQVLFSFAASQRDVRLAWLVKPFYTFSAFVPGNTKLGIRLRISGSGWCSNWFFESYRHTIKSGCAHYRKLGLSRNQTSTVEQCSFQSKDLLSACRLGEEIGLKEGQSGTVIQSTADELSFNYTSSES